MGFRVPLILALICLFAVVETKVENDESNEEANIEEVDSSDDESRAPRSTDINADEEKYERRFVEEQQEGEALSISIQASLP